MPSPMPNNNYYEAQETVREIKSRNIKLLPDSDLLKLAHVQAMLAVADEIKELANIVKWNK